MKKLLIYICIFTLTFHNISIASIKRTADLRVEEVIPIDIYSNQQDITEYIDISDYRDAEVIGCYVDNGEAKAEIIDDRIKLKLIDGEYSYTRDKVTKKYVEELEDLPLDNENNRTIVIEPEKATENICSVSGDFQSAKIDTDGNIVVKVKKSAIGIPGYDKQSIVTDTIDVKIDAGNRNENVTSEDYTFKYPIVKGTTPKIKYGTAFCNGEKLNSTDVKVITSETEFFVEFDNGLPMLNETKNEYTYPYYWIDRFSNGTFKPHYPNEVYNTPKVRFKGDGTWLPTSEKPNELTFIVDKAKEWTDYSGYELDGKKYVYIDTKSSKNSFAKGYTVLNSRSKVFNGQWFNTEKLTMTIEDDEIIYEPEGKLYSCGEFVPNTKGWGEMMPAKDWEIHDSFYNPYIDKEDTYVKHFKFFYGPEKKVVFGGYYTYPYSCTVEYEHYKPVDLYSGNIVYTYKEEQDKEGYYYNGWITIKHTVTKAVDDFPPESPYNLKYNKTSGILNWSSAKDDYTLAEDMRYEIQYQDNNTWKKIGGTDNGRVSFNYKEDGEFRVRAIDEMNQYSTWTYSINDLLEIDGEVIPRNIKAGDSIEIIANTLSHDEIVSVQAIQEELGINTLLNKTSSSKSNFTELAFGIYGHVDIGDYYIVPRNNALAYYDSNGNVDIDYYLDSGYADEDDSHIYFHMPEINGKEEIPISKNFTVIVPNQNFLNTPRDFFEYKNNHYALETDNSLYFYNAGTNRNDLLVGVDAITYRKSINWYYKFELDPKLRINTFEYDEKGLPKYAEVLLEKEESKLPITMTFSTNEKNITSVKVYLGDKLKYSYDTAYSNISKHIKGIKYYGVKKTMERYKISRGVYIYPSSNNQLANWAFIACDFRDVRDFKWLGCKYDERTEMSEDYAPEYNSYPTTRDVNRILFSDECLATESISKYIQLIKNSNLLINKRYKESVFGDDVMEITSNYKSDIIKTLDTAKEGLYWITLIARTQNGNEARVLLPLNIGEEKEEVLPEEEEKPEEEELVTNQPQIKSAYIGRFHYEDSEAKVVSLLKSNTTKNKSEGFISAGETLSLKLLAKNIDSLTIDIEGDKSIKTFDDLTKRFIYDEPLAKGKNVESLSKLKEKYSFPVTIYPTKINEDGSQIYEYKYVIPYKAKQTLHSWSSLRQLGQAGDSIDTSRILERISNPYKLVLKAGGKVIKTINFDVFERWDNVLNRDLSKYLI